MSFSIVIPVFNSAPVLPELHRRLSETMRALGAPYEIIFVDDSDGNGCWPVLQRLAAADRCVSAIQLMRNSGQSNATLCGLDHACGQLVVTMDDDLQHPPEELLTLLGALGDGVDVVMGVPREKQHGWVRRTGSSLMNAINRHLLGVDSSLRFSSFRLIRRPVVDALLAMRTISPALSPMLYTITRRIASVPVEHAPRGTGRSGYDMRRLLAHAMNNVIGYSMLPMRFLALIGAACVGSAACLAAVMAIRHFSAGGPVDPWAPIAVLLLLLAGLNFLALAFLGEYLLRVLQRVNAMPRYVIRTRTGRAGGSSAGVPAPGSGDARDVRGVARAGPCG